MEELTKELHKTLVELVIECRASKDPEVIRETAELLKACTKFLEVI